MIEHIKSEMRIVYKNIVILTISAVLLATTTGCNQLDLAQLKKLKSITPLANIVELRINQSSDDNQTGYNLDPDQGKLADLTDEEKQFLQHSLNTLLQNTSSALHTTIKKPTSQTIQLAAKGLNPPDEHLFIPEGDINLDLSNKDVIQEICAVLKTDGIVSIRLVFFRYTYSEFFKGTFYKIRVNATINILNDRGECVLSNVFLGESKSFLPADLLVTISAPSFGRGLSYSQKVDLSPEDKKRGSFSLDSKYGPLYKEAVNDLTEKLQDAINNFIQG